MPYSAAAFPHKVICFQLPPQKRRAFQARLAALASMVACISAPPYSRRPSNF
jgi:hypothetical protein